MLSLFHINSKTPKILHVLTRPLHRCKHVLHLCLCLCFFPSPWDCFTPVTLQRPHWSGRELFLTLRGPRPSDPTQECWKDRNLSKRYMIKSHNNCKVFLRSSLYNLSPSSPSLWIRQCNLITGRNTELFCWMEGLIAINMLNMKWLAWCYFILALALANASRLNLLVNITAMNVLWCFLQFVPGPYVLVSPSSCFSCRSKECALSPFRDCTRGVVTFTATIPVWLTIRGFCCHGVATAFLKAERTVANRATGLKFVSCYHKLRLSFPVTVGSNHRHIH